MEGGCGWEDWNWDLESQVKSAKKGLFNVRAESSKQIIFHLFSSERKEERRGRSWVPGKVFLRSFLPAQPPNLFFIFTDENPRQRNPDRVLYCLSGKAMGLLNSNNRVVCFSVSTSTPVSTMSFGMARLHMHMFRCLKRKVSTSFWPKYFLKRGAYLPYMVYSFFRLT